MNKYIEASEESKQDLKEAMLEQAYNNIIEDPDRIEKYIQENADVIQDILFRYGAYDSSPLNTIEAANTLAKIGADLTANVLLGIENMASEDVEDAMR